MDRYCKSYELQRRSSRVDARAAALSSLVASSASGALTYPRFAKRAAGQYLWDADENKYIDYILGFGTVILGHASRDVDHAVVEAIGRGIGIAPLMSELQLQIIELLLSVVPHAEMAYLLKTGSEATSCAVRLARIYTGREKVMRWGYNGWHDWACPIPNGVPSSILTDTITFEYNDFDSVRRAFASHPGEIACVIMMPFELDPPVDNFLQKVNRLAHENGALFILDEMRSGFRISLGGAQEYFNVSADMVTFSKAMGNGYAISAVVGRSELMAGLRDTRMFSTFYANPPEMAAARATITILRDTDALEVIWSNGQLLLRGLKEIVSSYDLPAQALGYPVAPFIRFDAQPVGRDRQTPHVKDLFFEEVTRQGVLFHPDHQWFVSRSHTESDIDMTLDACERAAQVVAERS